MSKQVAGSQQKPTKSKHKALFLALSALMAVNVSAEEYDFDVDAQRTDGSLIEIAKTGEVQVIFSPEPVEKNTSPEIRGTQSVDTALDKSLEATNLNYEFKSDDFVVVMPADSGDEASAEIVEESQAEPTILLAMLQDDNSRDDAAAQLETAEEEAVEEELEEGVEEIIVTGSRLGLSKDDLTQQSEIITAEDLKAMGQPTLDRALQLLPISMNSANDNLGAGGAVQGMGLNLTGMSTLNLRGYGSDATLVLLNGKPLGKQDLLGTATDISQIPIEIVERVEVILDGGSALYGSDAIGGVVNIITKKDVDYTSVKLQYGTPSNGGFDETRLSVTHGLNWSTGGITASLTHFDTSPLMADDSSITPPYANFVNNNYFGGHPEFIGEDAFLVHYWGGTLEDPVAPFFTAIDLDPQSGTVNDLYPGHYGLDNNEFLISSSLVPETTTESAYLALRQDLSDSVTLDVTLNYSQRESLTYYNQNGGVFNDWNGAWFFGDDLDDPFTSTFYGQFDTLRAYLDYCCGLTTDEANALTANPYNPIGTQRVTGFSYDGPPLYTDAESDTLSASLDLMGEFGDSAWAWRFQATRSETNSEAIGRNQFSNLAKEAIWSEYDVFGGSNPEVLLGPWDEARGQYANLFDDQTVSEDKTSYLDFHVRGNLFDMPAGPVPITVGMAYSSQRLFSSIGYNLGTDSIVGLTGNTFGSLEHSGPSEPLETAGKQSVRAFYLETLIPLFENLNMNLSARSDDYFDSNAGRGDSFAGGLNWRVNDVLRLKASYSESFKAPRLAYGFRPTTYNYFDDTNNLRQRDCAPEDVYQSGFFMRCANTQFLGPYLIISGGTRDLEPETSENTSFGFVLTPTDNLRFEVYYRETDLVNRIAPSSATIYYSNNAGVPGGNVFVGFTDPREVSPFVENLFIPGEDDKIIHVSSSLNENGSATLLPENFTGYISDRRAQNVGVGIQKAFDVSSYMRFDLGSDVALTIQPKVTINREFSFVEDPRSGERVDVVAEASFTGTGILIPKYKYYLHNTLEYKDLFVTLSASNSSKTRFVSASNFGTGPDIVRTFDPPWRINLNMSYDLNNTGFDLLADASVDFSIINLTKKFTETSYTVGGEPVFSASANPSAFDPRGRMLILTLNKSF